MTTNKEIVESVLKGETGEETLQLLIKFAPELYKVISEDMLKVADLVKEQALKDFVEECHKRKHLVIREEGVPDYEAIDMFSIKSIVEELRDKK
jgi:hypothetical protein